MGGGEIDYYLIGWLSPPNPTTRDLKYEFLRVNNGNLSCDYDPENNTIGFVDNVQWVNSGGYQPAGYAGDYRGYEEVPQHGYLAVSTAGILIEDPWDYEEPKTTIYMSHLDEVSGDPVLYPAFENFNGMHPSMAQALPKPSKWTIEPECKFVNLPTFPYTPVWTCDSKLYNIVVYVDEFVPVYKGDGNPEDPINYTNYFEGTVIKFKIFKNNGNVVAWGEIPQSSPLPSYVRRPTVVWNPAKEHFIVKWESKFPQEPFYPAFFEMATVEIDGTVTNTFDPFKNRCYQDAKSPFAGACTISSFAINTERGFTDDGADPIGDDYISFHSTYMESYAGGVKHANWVTMNGDDFVIQSPDELPDSSLPYSPSHVSPIVDIAFGNGEKAIYLKASMGNSNVFGPVPRMFLIGKPFGPTYDGQFWEEVMFMDEQQLFWGQGAQFFKPSTVLSTDVSPYFSSMIGVYNTIVVGQGGNPDTFVTYVSAAQF